MSTTAYIYSISRHGEVGAWTRYVFPFDIDNFCQQGDGLYIRAKDDVLLLDPSSTMDYDNSEKQQPFDGIIQWPWLDLGQPGQTKNFIGLDVSTINENGINVQIGYDQTDLSAFTDAYTIPGDTLPGTFVPFPVMGPSFSVRMTFSSLDNWQFQSATMYLSDDRLTS